VPKSGSGKEAKVRRKLIASTLLSSLVLASLNAAVVPGRWEKVEALPAGTRVQITLKSGEKLGYRLNRASVDHLTASDESGNSIDLSKAEIGKILSLEESIDSSRDGALWGLLIGAGGGAGIGAATSSRWTNEGGDAAGWVLLWTGVGTGVGAGLGFLLDDVRKVRTEHWAVIYEAR